MGYAIVPWRLHLCILEFCFGVKTCLHGFLVFVLQQTFRQRFCHGKIGSVYFGSCLAPCVGMQLRNKNDPGNMSCTIYFRAAGLLVSGASS